MMENEQKNHHPEAITQNNIPENRETKEFKYSVDNPPSADEIRDKVFAVHATSILPTSGSMKAGAEDKWNRWDGDEPPSFRPTIHFALGELVREHRRSSWEEEPYAVVARLRSLEQQLVNLFTHDSFILGDFKLTTDTILVVPEDTDTSEIPSDIPIVRYDSNTTLRQAVDTTIRNQNGWHIQMKPEGGAIGSTGKINNVEINRAEFFKKLIEERPYISFGTHIDPEKGEAFRIGVVERLIVSVMRSYLSESFKYSSVRVELYKKLIKHHIEKINQWIRQTSLNRNAIRVLKEKQKKVEGWLNIIDADLTVRKKLGVTLTAGNKRTKATIIEHRDNFRSLLNKVLGLAENGDLKNENQELDMHYSLLSEQLSGMTMKELQGFIKENHQIFQHINLPKLYVQYGIVRWILIGTKRAEKEGILSLIGVNLQLVKADEYYMICFSHLENFLCVDNNRLSLALEILKYKPLRNFLEEQYGFIFEKDEPCCIEDVVRAHPELKGVFDQETDMDSGKKEVFEFLNKLKENSQSYSSEKLSFDSFTEVKSTVLYIEDRRDRIKEEIEWAQQPMNSARNLQDIQMGDTLSLYEVLRRTYKNAASIWRKLNLEAKFLDSYPNEEDFWTSDKSLFAIVKKLNFCIG